MIASAEAAWKEAARRGDSRSWRLQIADCHVDFHFANRTLEAAYRPALEHLKVDTGTRGTAVAQIFLWDAAQGVPLPAPPMGLKQLGPHGQIPELPLQQHATFQGHSGVWSAFDGKAGVGFVAVRDAARLPNYELAAPMRALLGWLGAYNGFVLSHGAAVGTSAGAALLVGRGGSGKSTTSLNCLLEGFDFLGDDYVAIRTDNASKQPQVWSLFQSAKVSANSLELLPALQRGVKREPTSVEDDKFLLFAPDIQNGCVVKSRPLRALFLPVISEENATSLSASPRVRALAALAPSTVFQMAGLGALTLAQLTGVTQNVPAYNLRLGRDFQGPRLIKECLDTLQI